MKTAASPRGGLSVLALAIVLLVPLAVGWIVEHLAYGEARATETIVEPLRVVETRPAAAVRLAGAGEAARATIEGLPENGAVADRH
ncbi:MAG TPA: hypothetical protein VFY71_06450 [Planctomycetota bacterium]|nr:hypothetical protein [Planctomycetota bacterium]